MHTTQNVHLQLTQKTTIIGKTNFLLPLVKNIFQSCSSSISPLTKIPFCISNEMLGYWRPFTSNCLPLFIGNNTGIGMSTNPWKLKIHWNLLETNNYAPRAVIVIKHCAREASHLSVHTSTQKNWFSNKRVLIAISIKQRSTITQLLKGILIIIHH